MKIFYLPDLGEGLAEAEIREWYVNEGDEVQVDQPLASMETAKAVVDVPSPYTGKIHKLHGKVNEIIKTGAPLVTFEFENAAKDQSKGSVVGALEESSKKWEEGDVIIGTPKMQTQTAIKAMPAARMLAKELQVDLIKVKGTGPQGLITLQDVRQFHDQENALLKGHETESLHGVRRFMAQAMMQSHKEIVPVTIFEDADISHFTAETDITAVLIGAIIAAVKKEPALNAWFDGRSLERKLFSEVHLGIAVDTTEGLFVPVIKHAEQKSKTELREIVNRFKKEVRDRSIASSEMQGATFTLSNFGTIAGRYATPIIVPPAVAILACGKSREIALVKNGELQVGKIMPLSLTFDHRAVTGGEATRFLAEIVRYLQTEK